MHIFGISNNQIILRKSNEFPERLEGEQSKACFICIGNSWRLPIGCWERWWRKVGLKDETENVKHFNEKLLKAFENICKTFEWERELKVVAPVSQVSWIAAKILRIAFAPYHWVLPSSYATYLIWTFHRFSSNYLESKQLKSISVSDSPLFVQLVKSALTYQVYFWVAILFMLRFQH